MKKKSIWSRVGQDFQMGKVILKSEFIKKNNKRYLIATDTHIIMFKDQQYNIAIKSLPLNFDTKFELIRGIPKLKGGASPIKLQSTSRPDQVKSEHILQIGEINSLLFLREDDYENRYELKSDTNTLKEWRWYLGTKINQYGFHHLFKVFKKIGKGNFASVYLAERVEDGQQMAIKAFSKSVTYAEENGKEGLINEIKIMRQLNHPNIIQLYEVHETSNSLYVCLELLEGGQLYEYLKKKVIFQNKEIQVIIQGLLQGLKHIHDKDIMHRDIKLENILFKKSNSIDSVVLADFGLSTYVNEPVYLYCRCGTPGFVAPEVINIKDLTTKYDKVCDIYSLGLVFHLLLTGKPAFQGRSYTTIVNQNKEAKIQWKSSIFEIIQKNALDLLKKMLEPDPKKRISADEALKHGYFNRQQSPNQFDEDITEFDDSCQLDQRLSKINEQNNTFDMLRINQLTNSPIKSPNMRATQTSTLKEGMIDHGNQDDQMIMHTPVITGRIESVDGKHKYREYFIDSPNEYKMNIKLKQEITEKKQKHKRQESLSYLQKYSKQQQQQEVDGEQFDSEEKPVDLDDSREPQIQQVKQSLSKNV